VTAGAERLDATMSRRRLLRLGASFGVAAAATVALKALPAAAAESGFKVIGTVNLRKKPSTSSKVLLVIPAGEVVTDLDSTSNGFYKVSYQGTKGWVYGSYLASTNTDPGLLNGTAVTTSSVNLRAYPEVGDNIILVAPKGASIDTSEKTVDGFRYVAYNGNEGWMSDQFIGDSQGWFNPGDYATVTVNLNLRQQPSTSAKVMEVIPAGTQVQVWDEYQNGFRTVSYGNHTGWAYEAYLQR
jgi:uncharacterized protein YgiM (DUF1202 family)